MSKEKVRLWYVEESELAYKYCRLPPDRPEDARDDSTVWIPKSQVEHRSMQANGLHELTLPSWIVEAKEL